MMLGVRFGNQHSYNDFGLLLNSKTIGAPTVKTDYIDVPGRNGTVDMTESLTGYPVYNNRILKFEFTALDQSENIWAERLNFILDKIHGKTMNIVLDDDPKFYYKGRVSVSEYTLTERMGKYVVECDCDPFKYERVPNFIMVDSANPLGKYVQLISDTFRGYSAVGDTGFIETDGSDGVVSVYGYIPSGSIRTYVTLGANVPITKNHKYYIRSGNSDINIRLTNRTTTDIGENSAEYIFTATSTRSDLFPVFVVTVDGNISTTARPTLIDITQLYGAGNEPTDISDERIAVLRDLSEKRHGIADEYALVIGNGDAPAKIIAAVQYAEGIDSTTVNINGVTETLTYGRHVLNEELEPDANIITFSGNPGRSVMFEYVKGWL